MAVIEGGVSLALQGVGAENYSPGHYTQYPPVVGSGGAYRLGMTSGVMAVSLAANAELFQFRYVTAASRVCIVQRVTISIGMHTVVATAVAGLSVNMAVARAWTAAGSGGTRAVLTGDIANLRTAHATSEVNDAGISTTAGLTAGTKTIDHATSNLGAVSFSTLTGAMTTTPGGQLLPETELLGAYGPGGHPLVLANQEGFIIRNGTVAWPAGATWGFSVQVLWLEGPNF